MLLVQKTMPDGEGVLRRGGVVEGVAHAGVRLCDGYLFERVWG